MILALEMSVYFFKSRRNIAKYTKIVNVTGFISNMLIFRLKMI